MDAKDIHNLSEAYLEVYNPERIDEGFKTFPSKKVYKQAERKLDNKPKSFNNVDAEVDHMMDTRANFRSKDYDAAGEARAASAANINRPASEKRSKTVKEQVDTYDIILSHLLDEGYADTEEAATVIMANMSNKWICEAMTSYERNRQRAAQRAAARNAARDQGKTGNVPGVGYVTPRRERETWHDERGQERHTSGARMPKVDEEYVDEASSRDEFTRAAIARNSGSSGRKGGITFEPGPNWDPSANRGKGANLSPKQVEKQRRKALRQEEYVDEAQREDIMEISDRKVKAVRNARERQWHNQYGKNRVQDPTDDMIDKIDKLIDQRNKRTGSNVKKTSLGQLRDKNVARRRGEA
jgi:hypothetical protein